MPVIHNLGFPRIGSQRELKSTLETYWRGEGNAKDLLDLAENLRRQHWQKQELLDMVPVGDFSLYDQVLDMSFTLGNWPERAKQHEGNELAQYFRVARGRAPDDAEGVAAGEMTKWFDTNYHYIVPEVTAKTTFSLHAERLLAQVAEAKALGLKPKPVLIGPVTYLWLSKAKDGSKPLNLLPALLPVYQELLQKLAEAGVGWVQIDEPALVTELDPSWQDAYRFAYEALASQKVKLLLTTYFGQLKDNLTLVAQLPVAGIHIDAIRASDELGQVVAALSAHQVLSVGVIDGRNVWKTDLHRKLKLLTPLAKKLQERLWLAPSCSLLHVPISLSQESGMDSEIKDWLAFAEEKLLELSLLAKALEQGIDANREALDDNARAIANRKESPRVHRPHIKAAVAEMDSEMGKRQSAFEERSQKQKARLKLPLFPTTTIGSFPQTTTIRQTRHQFKKQQIAEVDYVNQMQQAIKQAITEQEALGLDVLVHGEAERNDMVEYFGELLEGFIFTENAWVQSYGSRCVKPPIIYGDVHRPKPMTVAWISYAQSLTDKPVKGMLTGPVTLLNWSFVRDDQDRSDTCRQLALAVRQEVQDLEAAGIRIIQIDEAALREGLPLLRESWQEYLNWAGECFQIAANGVNDETQIHTHMCYSEFNDIIAAIADLDADVITIETSRSDMELLQVFEEFEYPNGIGPGVYDIHSPNTPSIEHALKLLSQAQSHIPKERLWVNPDCGLKTRQWDEVIPALRNMVTAAKILRAEGEVV